MHSRLTIALSIFILSGGSACVPKTLAADAKEGPRDQESRPARKDTYGDPLPENAVARLGTLRLRKADQTGLIGFSSDGKLIAGTDVRGALYVWNAITGEEIARFNPKMDLGFQGFAAVVFSPDGKQLIYTSRFYALNRHGTYARDSVTEVWDIATKLSSRLLISLTGAAISPNGELLAGGGNRSLVIYDLKKHSLRVEIGYGTMPSYEQMVFSPDGKFIITAERRSPPCEFPTILRIWDARNGEQIANWGAPHQSTYSLSFSPDGKILASSGHLGVYLWDVAHRRLLAKLADKEVIVSFSPDGQLLATVGHTSNTILLWDAAKREKVRSIETGNTLVTALAFSPDGKKLLTGGWDHALHLWDVRTGQELLPLTGHRADVLSVQFSPDGKLLASSGGEISVLLWDLATGKARRRFTQGKTEGLHVRPSNWWPSPSHSLAYAPDGKTIAVLFGSYENSGLVWNVTSGRKELTLQMPKRSKEQKSQRVKQSATSIAFSPDSQVLATADDDSVRLWSTTSGTQLQSSPIPGTGPLAFSPDGGILAMGRPWSSGGKRSSVCLRDWRRLQLIRDFHTHKERVCGFAFSFDGQLMATFGGANQTKDSLIYLWDTRTGSQFQSLDHKEKKTPQQLMEMRRPPPVGHALYDANDFKSVLCVALSPDGHLLASGGEGDRAVHIWDVLTGKKLAQFEGHRGNIYCVAFSPDGKTVASGSADTTILLWDVSGLQPKPPATKTDTQELDRLWSALEKGVSTAYPAVWALEGAGDEAVAFLGQHLCPIPLPDAKRIPEFIADLDSEDFHKREAATSQLLRLRERAEPALRQALKAKPSLEARKRIEKIIADPVASIPFGEELRQIRTLHVLERIGSPNARALLSKLAEGDSDLRLTRDAKLAVQRLDLRSNKP